MSDPIICNVCRKPIDDPVEAAKERRYVIKANRKPLPVQRKHDVCAAAYEAEKTGLEITLKAARVPSHLNLSRRVKGNEIKKS